MKTEKIQKVLARTGIASRRTIEEWISLGRISIDGKPAKLGDRISLDAHICIDNTPVKIVNPAKITPRVLLYHKPTGEMCTRHDPEGRPTVFDHLPEDARWIMVGRLDYNTSGLLLFTNDGELAHKLMHPSSNIEREYAVRVSGIVEKTVLKQLKEGVMLEDGFARFESIHSQGSEGKNPWFHVVLKEGRNRIVRRLWASQGLKVNRLIRIRFGNILLPKKLAPGEWIELDIRSF